MQLLLLIAYPLCVHYAVVTANPEAQLLALVLLAAGISYPGIKRNSALAWLALLVVAALSLLVSYFQLTLYVLYLPPVIIPLLLWSVFYRSLQPGDLISTGAAAGVHPIAPGQTGRADFGPDGSIECRALAAEPAG